MNYIRKKFAFARYYYYAYWKVSLESSSSLCPYLLHNCSVFIMHQQQIWVYLLFYLYLFKYKYKRSGEKRTCVFREQVRHLLESARLSISFHLFFASRTLIQSVNLEKKVLSGWLVNWDDIVLLFSLSYWPLRFCLLFFISLGNSALVGWTSMQVYCYSVLFFFLLHFVLTLRTS